MEKFDLYRDIAERTDGDITLEWWGQFERVNLP